MLPLLMVDSANVVGSVPDGWWRDRHAAAVRLRDALADVAATGLPPLSAGPLDVLMVVEGQARQVEPMATVRIVAAPRSADDAIVALAKAEHARRPGITVVTADRMLRNRLAELGVGCLGPRALPYPDPLK